MKRLNELEIKDILKNREEKITDIHKKIFLLHQELADTDGLLASIALPSQTLDKMPRGKGSHKDLGDILSQYDRRSCIRGEEIRKAMWKLSEEEDSIYRVWMCFQKLKNPYYSILHAIYVEKQLYEAVEREFGSSHKTFEKYRKRAIEQIMSYYQED